MPTREGACFPEVTSGDGSRLVEAMGPQGDAWRRCGL